MPPLGVRSHPKKVAHGQPAWSPEIVSSLPAGLECGHPPQAFLAVMEAWNTVMDDLQGRFPNLREIRPPNLSQNDLGAESAGLLGRYRLKSSTMQFTNPFCIHWARYSEDPKNDSLTSPKREGFEGIVLHEYAHHLRAEVLSDPRRWLTGLAAMLKENGYIDDE